MARRLATAVAWIEGRFPDAAWETRGDDAVRALMCVGGFDLEVREQDGSLVVATSLEDCRDDDDDWLDDACAAWEARRDAAGDAVDFVEVVAEGRVVYARFVVDDDAPDDAVALRLASFTAWLDAADAAKTGA